MSRVSNQDQLARHADADGLRLKTGGDAIALSWRAPAPLRSASTGSPRSSRATPPRATCQMVRQAATKTNDRVGDGTTTATLLAAGIYGAGLRYATTGNRWK